MGLVSQFKMNYWLMLWNRSARFRLTQWLKIIPRMIRSLLLHKWAGNFQSLCSSWTRTRIPCPVESLHWLWHECPVNVYLDSKRVSILVKAVLPALPMLYLPFNVYLDSKRVSILVKAVLPALPMLYLPFNVYLDSKRVSILIEAVLPALPMLYSTLVLLGIEAD